MTQQALLETALDHKQAEISAPLDYARHPLRIVINSQNDLNLRVGSCAKEPETIAWLERECHEGDVLYDVGACVGAYSLVAASLGAMVYAFEPSAENFRSLCSNITLNAMARIRAIAVGLGAHDALRYLNLSSVSSGAASHVVSDFATGKNTQVFPQLRLDMARTLFKPLAPTLMKIDVDGCEVAVLEGAAETLRSEALRSVQIEQDAEHGDEVRNLMEAAGFREADRHQRLGKVPLWNVEYRKNAQ